jgi:hypothetical protein
VARLRRGQDALWVLHAKPSKIKTCVLIKCR